MDRIHTYDEREINFHNVDVHATKEKATRVSSLVELVEFFKVPIIDQRYKEIFLVREFLVWMNFINIRGTDDMSEEMQNLLKEHKTTALEQFCKATDIRAEKIFGVGKNLKYIPGQTEQDSESITNTAWIAFRSDDSWHLVDPQRALGAITGYTRGGEILLEIDGRKVLKEQNESTGARIEYVDDFWFCLHPSIFITKCLPEDPRWQLLPHEHQKSMSEFLSSPDVESSLFKAKLHLLSEQKCVIQTRNGRCTITFGADKFEAKYISMSYKLSLRSETGSLQGVDANDLPLLVRYAPGLGTFSFNIRLPVRGEYIFETYVKASGMEKHTNCSKTKIICTDPDPKCKKLPFDAGIVGYGFGYKAVDFGLRNPSSAEPSLTINRNENDDITMKEITFEIEDDRILDVQFSSDVIGEDNKENVTTETHVDEVAGKLYVKAAIKKEGEYALSIIAKEKDENLFSRVVNYLLTTESFEEDKDFQHVAKKRKKELTLEAKLQELGDKRSILQERIAAMKAEIDDLKKMYEENNKHKQTQTEDGLLGNKVSTNTTETQTFEVSHDNIGTQTDMHTPMVADKETQSEEQQADMDSILLAMKKEQAFVLKAIERDGKLVIVASKSEEEQIPDEKMETEKANKQSKICTVL